MPDLINGWVVVPPDGQWVTVREAAAALGVSTTTVKRRTLTGELPARHEGRRVQILLPTAARPRASGRRKTA